VREGGSEGVKEGVSALKKWGGDRRACSSVISVGCAIRCKKEALVYTFVVYVCLYICVIQFIYVYLSMNVFACICMAESIYENIHTCLNTYTCMYVNITYICMYL